MNILWRSSAKALAAISIILLQCSDLTDPTGPTPTSDILFTLNTTGAATPSLPYSLAGTVSSINGLDSIIIRVTDPDGNPFGVSTSIKLLGATSYTLQNSQFRLSVNASSCNGTYRVNIHAFSGITTASRAVTVTVSGARVCSVVVTPSLTLGSLSGKSSVSPDAPIVLTGTVSCMNCQVATVLTANVKDSSGATVTDNSITATVTTTSAGYSVSVSALRTACNGNYTISVTASNGTLTKSVTKLVTVSGAINCGVPTGDLQISNVLILGAQNASEGSSLEIDYFKVLTSANAKQQESSIDLIVGYSAVTNSMMFGSPYWAKDKSLTVVNSWTTYNTTLFKPLSQNVELTSATQFQLVTLWNNASQTAQGVTLTTGKQYLTVTSQGAIALINVISLSNATDGKISIVVGRTAARAVTAPTPYVSRDLVVSATLVLGADENTVYGSSIDLDEPKVLLASAAKTAASEIDLVYVYSFATDEDVLGTPSWANASGFTFVSGWSTYNATKFYKLPGAVFESITTKAQLEALWQETLAIDPSVPVATNNVVIAKTDKGTIALMKIVRHVPGDTGHIEIKVAQ